MKKNTSSVWLSTVVVSTDRDEQATSYEAQIEHYTAFISGHPEWQLSGIFADDGILGTNKAKFK